MFPVKRLLLAEGEASEAVVAAVVFDCIECASQDVAIDLGARLRELRLRSDVLKVDVKIHSSRDKHLKEVCFTRLISRFG